MPLFFIGASPSQAATIINPLFSAAGVMISCNQLRKRRTNFSVGTWIMDSGAFTEIAKYGKYRFGTKEYYEQICRWTECGNLLIAVAQDWMCEPLVLNRTGLTISDHQRLTIERYEHLMALKPPVPIMPVLQGYRTSDYLQHLKDYGDRLPLGAWVGIGSVCRRNGKADEVADILRAIKLIRPDLKLHGFGLKILALENAEVNQLLYSHDSMAWSFPRKFQDNPKSEILTAYDYQEKIYTAVGDCVRKRTPVTAGANNGQGRKPKWKSKTIAIRVPEKFSEALLKIAHSWEQ